MKTISQSILVKKPSKILSGLPTSVQLIIVTCCFSTKNFFSILRTGKSLIHNILIPTLFWIDCENSYWLLSLNKNLGFLIKLVLTNNFIVLTITTMLVFLSGQSLLQLLLLFHRSWIISEKIDKDSSWKISYKELNFLSTSWLRVIFNFFVKKYYV